MESFLHILGLIAQYAGWGVALVFAFGGAWNVQLRQKRAEKDDLEDQLIKRLQQTVEQQALDLNTMRTDMAEHTKHRDAEVKELRDQLKHMQGRNAVLEDLFKGRDPQMQAFLKDAPTLMDIARENNGLSRENAKSLQSLESTLARFVDSLQPFLIHLETGTKSGKQL